MCVPCIVPHGFQKYSSEICSLLINLSKGCQDNNALSNVIRDSCISALGKIALTSYAETDVDSVVLFWLQNLPLRVDVLESISCYNLLCMAVQRNDVHVIGPNMQNLPLIVQIFLSIIQFPFIPKDLSTTMKSILLKINMSDESIRRACFSNLPQQLNSALSAILQESSTQLQ